MSTLEYILLFVFLGSVGSLAGGIVLLSHKTFALKISHLLASFAAGVLLGSAFFDLLPEAVHEAEETGIDVFFWTLAGIIIFFLIERFIHWFHHHEEYHDHEHHGDQHEKKNTVPLIIIGDTVHNFIDGVVIAATFMISIPLGISTTLAVMAHEIPQEVGDFGLLMHKGLKPSKIIWVNIISAGAAFAGALLIYFLGESLETYMPIFLALTAGFFIYIATSDLIPEIHHERRRGFALMESGLLILGIVTIWLSVTLLSHAN